MVINMFKYLIEPKSLLFPYHIANRESQYIITGDKDLLVLNPFRSAIIITAEEFLKTIEHE